MQPQQCIVGKLCSLVHISTDIYSQIRIRNISFDAIYYFYWGSYVLVRSFVFLFACVCYSFKSFEQIFMKIYVNMAWPKEEVVKFYERCRSYSGSTLITNFQRSEFKCVFQ